MYELTMQYTNEYLRAMPIADLRSLAVDARQASLDLSTVDAQAFVDTDKSHFFAKVRRDIARIETELRR